MTWPALVAALQPSIRAGVAAGLAVPTAEALRLRYPLYAMIAAVIVTDLLPSRTRRLALVRLVGTVLGATLGAVIQQILPSTAWTVGLGVLVAMFLSYLWHLNDAAKLAGYVCGVVVLNHADEPWTYAVHRVLETALGIGLAVLVSFVPKLVRIDERKPEDP